MSEYQELIGKFDKDDDKVTGPALVGTGGQPQTILIQEAVHMQKQSAEGLMSLLRVVGKAYSLLTSYESRAAIEVMESLSANQKKSGWILSLMAKAHFELTEYKRAAK